MQGWLNAQLPLLLPVLVCLIYHVQHWKFSSVGFMQLSTGYHLHQLSSIQTTQDKVFEIVESRIAWCQPSSFGTQLCSNGNLIWTVHVMGECGFQNEALGTELHWRWWGFC